MTVGTRTTVLPTTALADDILVNRAGNTRRQAIAEFIAQIGGSAALKEMLIPNARGLKGGGSDPYSDAKFDFFFGVLRQNAADRTRYYLMDDDAHRPMGFDPDPNMLASDGSPLYPRASGGSLLLRPKLVTDAMRINVATTVAYEKVLGMVAVPDEILSRNWGITLGAKVTRTGVQINGSSHFARHGRVYWNIATSQWVCEDDGFHPTGVVTPSWNSSTGVLTVTHDWIPGQDLVLVPDSRAGLAPTPFMPVRYSVNTNGTEFMMQFMADGTGPGFAARTGAPGSGMSFRWTKTYNGPLYLDGTQGFNNIPLDGAANIWVVGGMERP